jgi:hypothetical protein
MKQLQYMVVTVTGNVAEPHQYNAAIAPDKKELRIEYSFCLPNIDDMSITRSDSATPYGVGSFF